MEKVTECLKKSIKMLKEANVENADIDAFLLLSEVTSYTKNDLLLNRDLTMDEDQAKKYRELILKRMKRIPLQYIIGKAYFYGREFMVNKSVLIPRFDTEVLVEEVLKVIDKEKNTDILDICTGSGCIITTICLERKNVNGLGCDISPKALEVAKTNAERFKADNVTFAESDLLDNITGMYDAVISNPPYIADEIIKELEPEVKDHEPLLALKGGRDGLVFYKKIISGLKGYIKENGYVFFEIGYDQGEKVSELLKEEGFSEVEIIKDYSGNDRIVKAVNK